MEKIDFEQKFWGNCCNTYGEETKQMVYAKRMGLTFTGDWRSDFNIDMRGATVIDIGGGPVSLLLKAINVTGFVVDPLPQPEWVLKRYEAARITFWNVKGEELKNEFWQAFKFDEAWIYNVLQHVDDPKQILNNARALAKIIRLFEWINIPPHEGHPHMLTEQFLTENLGPGNTELLNGNGCHGMSFFGAWKFS